MVADVCKLNPLNLYKIGQQTSFESLCEGTIHFWGQEVYEVNLIRTDLPEK